MIPRHLHKCIDGVKLATNILSETKDGVTALTKIGGNVSLISIGFTHGDPAKKEAQARYVRNQMKAAQKVGIAFSEKIFPQNCSKDDLLNVIKAINEDKEITGLIVQRPVPEHLSLREIQELIDPMKDVEGK